MWEAFLGPPKLQIEGLAASSCGAVEEGLRWTSGSSRGGGARAGTELFLLTGSGLAPLHLRVLEGLPRGMVFSLNAAVPQVSFPPSCCISIPCSWMQQEEQPRDCSPAVQGGSCWGRWGRRLHQGFLTPFFWVTAVAFCLNLSISCSGSAGGILFAFLSGLCARKADC